MAGLSRHGNRVEHLFMAVGNRLVAQSADMGALPTLFAATQDIPGDTYIGPGGPGEARGYPAVANRTHYARDAQMAAQLWERSEQLTGVSFPREMAGLHR